MGSGIITALALSNISVVLKELNGSFLEQGMNRVKGSKRYMQLSFVLFLMNKIVYVYKITLMKVRCIGKIISETNVCTHQYKYGTAKGI